MQLFRFLVQQKIALVIRTVSVAFCLLLFYHIRWEQGFDRFHANKDRLFRCEMQTIADGTEKNQLVFPFIAGPDLQRNFPEVAAYNRLGLQGNELVKAGDIVYSEKEVVHADANFFRLFFFSAIERRCPDGFVLATECGVVGECGQEIFWGQGPGRPDDQSYG